MDILTNFVAQRGGTCLCLTSRVRYHETDMFLRTSTAASGTTSQELVHRRAKPRALSGSDEVSKAKLVQYEWTGAALFMLDGRFTLVSFMVPVWVSVVDTTTAEVYDYLNKVVEPPLQRITARFCRTQRLCTTDGAKEIRKAERVRRKANPDVATCHTTCKLHKVALVATRVALLMSAEVSLLIHLALSLQISGGMRRFRQYLREVLAERLVVLHGSPGPEADKHRQGVLDLFCPIISNRARQSWSGRWCKSRQTATTGTNKTSNMSNPAVVSTDRIQ